MSQIVVDGNNTILVADFDGHRVCQIKDKFVKTIVGKEQGFKDGPAEIAKFSNPISLAIDRKGNLYISDNGNQLIRYVNNVKLRADFDIKKIKNQNKKIKSKK